jgi:hypothetical protein
MDQGCLIEKPPVQQGCVIDDETVAAMQILAGREGQPSLDQDAVLNFRQVQVVSCVEYQSDRMCHFVVRHFRPVV